MQKIDLDRFKEIEQCSFLDRDKNSRFAELSIYNRSLGLEVLVFIHNSDTSLFDYKLWSGVKKMEQIREIIDYILSKEVDFINEISYWDKLDWLIPMKTEIKINRSKMEEVRNRVDYIISAEFDVAYDTSYWDKLAETILNSN